MITDELVKVGLGLGAAL